MSWERHPDDWAVDQIHQRFWQLAGSSAEARGVDGLLVEAVQEALLCEDVMLAWMVVDAEGVRGFDSGAATRTIGGTPAVLEGGSALHPVLQRSRLDLGGRAFAHQVWTVSGGLCLHAARRVGPGSLELLLRAAQPLDVHGHLDGDRIAELEVQLQRPVSSLDNLIASIVPLRSLEAVTQRLSRVGRQERLDRAIQQFVSFEKSGLQETLRRAVHLLMELADSLRQVGVDNADLEGILKASERVLRVVVHRVLGSDWSARRGSATRQEDEAREVDLLVRISHGVELLLARRHGVPVGPASPSAKVVERLILLNLVLESATNGGNGLPAVLLPPDGDGPPDTTTLRDWEMRLFVIWSLAHDACRHARFRRGGADRDDPVALQTWGEAVARTCQWLPHVLASWSAPRTGNLENRDPFDATRVRNWFRLWFALGLIQGGADDAKGSAAEWWSFRADLGYVLRECLRFKLYGNRPGFVVRPDAFSSALQTLVDHHVRRRVNLPREHDVRSHLTMVGDARHPRGYLFAAGHLQHVLEIYIVGHFLCEVRLENADQLPDAVMGVAPQTMGDLLAGRAGVSASSRARGELRAAFSLAALFHDVGMTLFPDFRRPRDPVAGDDISVAEGLDGVETALEGAGRALIQRASRELEHHGVWDSVDEPGLAEWIAEQEECGVPDHALTGAWYLLRAARRVEDLAPEVLRAAVRAVLLHGAIPQAIDPERDPVAALLVLCDELFDWEPGGRSGPDPATLGRSLHALAVDMSPRRSRASHIRFHDTRVAVVEGAEGPELAAFVDLEASRRSGRPGGWPHIELQLVAPEFLGPHVFPVWLSIGQNVGRIRPGVWSWGPVITVVGDVPDGVRRTTGTSIELLGRLCAQVRSSYRGRLARWLDDRPVVTVLLSPGQEAIVIEPLGRAVGRRDLRPVLGELTQAAERLMLEIEGRRR